MVSILFSLFLFGTKEIFDKLNNILFRYYNVLYKYISYQMTTKIFFDLKKEAAVSIRNDVRWLQWIIEVFQLTILWTFSIFCSIVRRFATITGIDFL